MRLSKSFLVRLFVLVYCFSSFHYFLPVWINGGILVGSAYLLTFIAILISFKTVFIEKFNKGYGKGIIFILAGLLMSSVSAIVFWRQSIFLSLLGMFSVGAYFFYFFLVHNKISKTFIEKVILIVGTVYAFCFLFALYKFPDLVFGVQGYDASESRGFIRLSIGGQGFVYLGFFLALNKYVSKRKSIWLIISAVYLIFIGLLVVRQTLIACVLIGFLYLFKNLNWVKKTIFIIVSASFFYFVMPYFPFVQKMYELTENQMESQSEGEENIRITSARFFLTEFSPNVYAQIFGNGIAQGNSAYALRVRDYIGEQLGFYQGDIGFIGLYSRLGILSILGYLLIYIRMFRHKLPENCKYPKLYLYFILMTGFTMATQIHYYFILSIVLSVYLLQFSKNEVMNIRKLEEISHKA